jgi:hypothetical protein
MSHEKLFIEKAKQLFPIMFQGRTPDECWIWGGRITWSVKVDGKILSTVLRRIAYSAFRGEVPPFHEVKTTRKQSGCVNPNHLTTRLSLRLISEEFDDGSVPSVIDEVTEPSQGSWGMLSHQKMSSPDR